MTCYTSFSDAMRPPVPQTDPPHSCGWLLNHTNNPNPQIVTVTMALLAGGGEKHHMVQGPPKFATLKSECQTRVPASYATKKKSVGAVLLHCARSSAWC